MAAARERQSQNVETAKRFFAAAAAALRDWLQEVGKTAVSEACRALVCAAPLLRETAEFVGFFGVLERRTRRWAPSCAKRSSPRFPAGSYPDAFPRFF